MGEKSAATVDKGSVGYLAPSGANNETWKSTEAGVSIGDTTDDGNKITRQLHNLAAGTLDTDAVNVAQLKALEQKSATGQGKDFSVSANSEAKNSIENGDNINLSNGNNINVVYTGSTNEKKFTFNLNDDISIASATIGSIKINENSNGKITNLSDGSINQISTDAITGGQIYSISLSSVNLMGDSYVNEKGEIIFKNTDNKGIGGTGKDNIHEAIGSIGSKINQVDNNTWKLTAGATGTGKVINQDINDIGKDSKVEFIASDNLIVSHTKNVENSKVEYSLNENLTNIKTIESQKVTTNELKAGAVTISDSGIDAGNKKIINVDAGSIKEGSTEVVVGGQVFEIIIKQKEELAQVIGGETRVENEKVVVSNIGGTGKNTIHDAIEYVKENSSESSIAKNPKKYTKKPVAKGDDSLVFGYNSQALGKNSVVLGSNSSDDGRDNVVSVGSKGKERVISNVSRGIYDTDAVNLGQLKESISSVYKDLGEYRDESYAGSASAIALGGLLQATIPGKNVLSLSGGNYEDQSAVDIGISGVSDNGQWLFKAGGSYDTQDNHGFQVSIGLQF